MYWIVTVPYEASSTKSKTFKKLQKKMTENKTCECYEFSLPKFKVGTLDSLMSLGDELIKIDPQVEAITMKILRQYGELSQLSEQEFIPEIMHEETAVPVELYLRSFRWDDSQYMITRNMNDLTATILKKAVKYESELKAKSNDYSTLRQHITAIERKTKGALTVRSLDGVIKKENVIESEYLTTLFVVVPTSSKKEWEKGYETLDDIEQIVPDSSECLVEENDFCLYNVVLMRKIANDFRNACMKKKYVVRDFEYDEERFELSKLEKENLEQKKEATSKDLFEWCKVAFSECFSSWIHLKAIRTFTESILRYGLPPKMVSMMIKVDRNERKIHKFFKDNFKHLLEDQEFFESSDESTMAAAAAYGEFHPYILITVNTNYPYLHFKE